MRFFRGGLVLDAFFDRLQVGRWCAWERTEQPGQIRPRECSGPIDGTDLADRLSAAFDDNLNAVDRVYRPTSE